MTLRLTLGIDPGQTGAIAVIADGKPVALLDMPTVDRKAGGQMIDAKALAAKMRGVLMQHSGAYAYAVFEQVSAGPGQGVSSMFRFGQSDGIVRGVIGSLGIDSIEVHPQVWKRHVMLSGKDKDAARLLAIKLFPAVAGQLARKKDCGRADALLIAYWAEVTEQVARAA
jgi:crossover junction endodeoxyribonuclease RuvC